MNKMPSCDEKLASIQIQTDRASAIRGELADMGIHHATVYADLASICKAIQDELDVPIAMRREGHYWMKRQSECTAHVLALLLINDMNLKVGDSFEWVYEISDGGTVGQETAITREELERATKLAEAYSLRFRVKRHPEILGGKPIPPELL